MTLTRELSRGGKIKQEQKKIEGIKQKNFVLLKQNRGD